MKKILQYEKNMLTENKNGSNIAVTTKYVVHKNAMSRNQ